MILSRRRAGTRRALLPTLLFAAAALPLFAAGCQTAPSPGASPGASGGGDAAATEAYAPPPAPEGALRVGLITPGKVSDQGWNASADRGVKRIASELGAEATPPVEGVGVAEVAGAARNLAQAGSHLVFLHGSEFDEGAASVAPDFQQTTFVVVGGRTVKPNLTPIQFSAGEATYLAGMLAAGMSKSGKIACVGAAEIPIVKDSFASFEKGAKALKPDIQVRIAFIGDESDTSKGKQLAQSLFAEGVDVIMHNANEAGKGVAQAVMEKDGAYFIGANAPQDDLATPKNLGSFIVDAPNAYVAVAKVVKEGKGEGKPFPSGLKEGAVGFHYNPKFAGSIPADLKAKVAQAEKDIIAGKVDANPENPAMAAGATAGN